MRRIQIYIEEELDELLQAEAARTGQSRAALIRQCVSSRFGRSENHDTDPLTALVGKVDVEPGNIDDIVYGP